MDERIIKFIKKHHLMTIATSQSNIPWVCHAFYALTPDNALVFTSSEQTKHISQALQNPQVAVSIALESKVVGRLQGVQINGVVKHGEQNDKNIFLKKFPYAIANLQPVWRIEIEYAKYTDNTLGFGTKLLFDKNNINQQ